MFVAAFVASDGIAQIPDFDHVVLLAQEHRFSNYNDVWGFVGSDGREYVIQGTAGGTAWWDVDDPVHPELVTFLEEPGSNWRDMFVIGDWAYIVSEALTMGVRIVDISVPSAPTYVASYTATVGASHNVFGDPSRGLLFVVGGFSGGANGGLQILDASDPLNLVEIGQWTQAYVHDLSIEGDFAYLCAYFEDRLRIVDISDSTNPLNVGSFLDPTGAVHASWPVGDGDHVLITEEITGGHVKSVDVSNPALPTLADLWNPDPTAVVHNVHVEGDLAYVSWYRRGTRVLDISNPASLSEVGYWDTSESAYDFGGNWGVFPHFPSGLVAANDRQNGLFLMKYDPDAGVLDGTVSASSGTFPWGTRVTYRDLALTQVPDSTGAYRFSAFPGPSHDLVFAAFGFAPDSATVSLAADGTTTTNKVLAKLPSGGVAGTVTNAQTAAPLPAVEIELAGTPVLTTTDATGAYSLPDVPAGSYSLVARAGGSVKGVRPAIVTAGLTETVDVALEPAFVFVDFSNPTGWTVQSDPGVITGIWVFEDPFGTFLGDEPFQPEDDHTLDPETICAVTGNMSDGVDDDDVDGGATRLLSPVYDLSHMSVPHVQYWRWYANQEPDDYWEVEVSSDGGTSWTFLERIRLQEPFWKGVDANLTTLLDSFGSVRFRFTAQDFGPSQIVEAAVDDFTLYDGSLSGTGTPGSPLGASAGLRLEPPSPNPFVAATTVSFTVPAPGPVELSIYDVRGALVATLKSGVVSGGRHEVVWDGRTRSGGRAAAGVYLVELRTSEGTRATKIVRRR
jgi:choice-of-anchor B domain-containing protein